MSTTTTSPGTLETIMEAIKHPFEYRILAQYSVFHEPKRDITSPTEFANTRYNEPNMRKCWDLLDSTAGLYASVVKELDGDLGRVICIAYLVFHALRVIERTTSLDNAAKEASLRNFYQKITKTKGSFDEKTLVDYDAVAAELALLSDECRTVIVETAKKMGAGMADFVHRAARTAKSGTSFAVPRISDGTEYNLYCHYIAGLIGEACSILFVSVILPPKKTFAAIQPGPMPVERPFLADQALLSNSYGLLVQKAHDIVSLVADTKEGMWVWPKDIVARAGVSSVEALVANGQGEGEMADSALWALSEMILGALAHVPDTLDYLVLLKNQSTFNMAAYPAAMALAMLNLCFMNANVYVGDVELRKAETIKLLTRSTDPHTVAYSFLEYSRQIHAKATPRDPHFLAISVMCGKIETWVEHHYPSYITFSTGSRTVFYDDTDPRSRIVKRDKAQDEERARAERQKKRDEDMRVWLEKSGIKPKEGAEPGAPLGKDVKLYAADGAPWQLYFFLIGGILLLFAMSAGLIVGGLWYFFGDEWQWEPPQVDQGIVASFQKIFGVGRFGEAAAVVKEPLVVQR